MLERIRDITLTLAAVTIMSVFLMAVTGQGDIVLIHGFNGSGPVPVRADLSTRALVAINYEHHEVHNNNLYMVSDYATVDDGNTRELLIETPDSLEWAHFTFEVIGTYETTVQFYEATTKTTGTSMTEINHNRNSSNTTNVVVTHTPGSSGDGSLIFQAKFGGDTGPAMAGGIRGNIRPEQELMLKQNTKYLLRITSGTDSNNITTLMGWYDHANED
jgi:hypothetical protein